MIKVIIFDVGGVLYKRSYYGYYKNSFRYFSKKLGIEPSAVERAFRSSDYKIATGKETTKDFLKKVSKKLGKEVDEKDFLRILKEPPKMMSAKTLNLAIRLKKRYTVVVLSNNIRPATIITKKKLRKYFHKMYHSDELGMKKPEPRIYKYVIKDLGVSPNECVFIDDKPENVKAAKKLGMKAINFNVYDMDYRDIVRMLKENGVVLEQ